MTSAMKTLCNFFDKEFLAELISTCILIMLGDGSVAQWVLLNQGNALEPFLLVNFGYGAAVAFGCYVAAGISGAHMNPAVSLSLAVVGKFPWKRVPKYVVAQLIGAFVGAFLVFLVYIDRLSDLSGDEKGIFATYPNADTSTGGRVIDQIVGTAILLLLICALTDSNNSAPPPGMTPLCVGGVVFAIGASFGTNCGYPINPARDFAPRLASLILGYKDTFSAFNHYFWIPILCPMVGGVLGTCIYTFGLETTIHCVPPTRRESERHNARKTSHVFTNEVMDEIAAAPDAATAEMEA